MAKDNELEEFGFEPIEKMDGDLGEFGFEPEPQKTGVAEGMLRGGAQGITFNFADEIQAALEAVGKDLKNVVGSKLGLVDDVEEEKEPVTFDEQGIPIIPESSGKVYRDRLEEIRSAYKKAAEDQPVAYYGSEIASGIIPGLLTGGATAAATVGKAGLKAAAKQAAKTGIPMGAATALGASEADLTKGEIAQAALETGVGAVLGGGLGLATPYAMSTLGKGAKATAKGTKALLENVPGAEIAKISYKAGKKGIGTSADALMEEALKVSKKFNDKIRSVLSKSGVKREEAVRLADEAGKKIDAGVPLDKILKEIQEEGAIGLEIKDRNKLFDELSSLKQGFDEQVTFRELEAKQAKQALQENLDYGSQLESTTEIKRPFEDILIKPESEGNVFGLRSKYSAPGPAGKRIEYTKTLLKSIPDPKVKRIVYDIENASPSKVQGILNYLNRTKVGDLSKPPVGHEAVYRKVAVELRSLLDEAVGEFADPTKAMAKTYRGAEKLGVQQASRGAEAAINDNIDDMAKKLLSSGTPSEIDKKRAFQYFKEASPEYADVIDEAEFISKLNSSLRGGMTAEGVQTTSLRGLAGSAIGGLAKVSNVAGRVSVPISKKIAPVTQRVSKVANKVGEFTDDQLIGASERLLSSENSGLQAMGRQLQFALQQGEPIKNASIWSLSQQPAFRKTIQKAIGLQEEGIADYFGFKPTKLSQTLFPTEDNVGREPQSLEEPMMSIGEPAEVPPSSPPNNPEGPNRSPSGIISPQEEEEDNITTPRDTYEYIKVKEGSAYSPSIKKEVEPTRVEGKPNLVGLIGTPNSRIKGTGEAGYYYDAAGKLTRGYGELVTKEPTLDEVKNYTVTEARADLDRLIQNHKQKIETAIGIPLDDFLTEDQQKGIISYYYNVGINPEHNSIKKLKEAANAPDVFTKNELLKESIKEMDINKAGGKFLQGLENRRIEERGFAKPNEDYLKMSEDYKYQIPKIMQVEKNINRESVQLGSNATPGTNRATLEDLMNSLNALKNGQNEATVAEMEDYAMAGDMNGLQELLDRFKSSSMA